MRFKTKISILCFILLLIALPLALGASKPLEKNSSTDKILAGEIRLEYKKDGESAVEITLKPSVIPNRRISKIMAEPASPETREADINLPEWIRIPKGLEAYKVYSIDTSGKLIGNDQIKGNFTLSLGYPKYVRPEVEKSLRIFILHNNRWLPIKSQLDISRKMVKTESANQFGIYRLLAPKEENTQDIILYPNPVQFGVKTLKFLNVPEGSEIEVYTITGEQIWKSGAVEKKIITWDGKKNDSDEFAPSGLYIYRIHQVGKESFGKIVVQK